MNSLFINALIFLTMAQAGQVSTSGLDRSNGEVVEGKDSSDAFSAQNGGVHHAPRDVDASPGSSSLSASVSSSSGVASSAAAHLVMSSQLR